MAKTNDRPTNLPGPSDEDIERINSVLTGIGGRNVVWGAGSVLDVWLAEARLEAERLANRRLLIATWALVGATAALVAATVGLIYVGG
ncbi:hypothetical protein [Aeromicrobium duanguangcaii]|uniref:hypothetical protein n=1 Tax=Aeromicrobium duanguangcaii TaxID=2968086 RepID=UPI0020181C8C|nr:hypothetical protein [Aeromicrobium duanguangcaii]MCL3838500.1 hypothetical protein [Aeromicrobium duanguangcaii]